MTAPVPSRAAIDRAGDLDFRAPARKEMVLTIHAQFDGFSIDVNYTGSMDTLPGAIKRLRELGAEPARENLILDQVSKARKPATRVQPAYDGDGQAICPVHRKVLSEGRYGLYCPSKATGDQAANDKGYCSLRFEWLFSIHGALDQIAPRTTYLQRSTVMLLLIVIITAALPSFVLGAWHGRRSMAPILLRAVTATRDSVFQEIFDLAVATREARLEAEAEEADDIAERVLLEEQERRRVRRFAATMAADEHAS